MKILYSFGFIALLSCTSGVPPAWKRVDVGPFSMEMPAHWQRIDIKGIDSYVSGFTDRRDTMIFDFGRYSPSVEEENRHDHLFALDTLCERVMLLAVSEPKAYRSLQMSIALLDGRNDLYMFCEHTEKVDTLLKIIESIRTLSCEGLKNKQGTVDRFQKKSSEIESVMNGKKLFTANCAPCHGLDEVLVGPALGRISKRRTAEWFYLYLTKRSSLPNNKETMLYQEAGMHCVEFENFEKKELEKIYRYLQ